MDKKIILFLLKSVICFLSLSNYVLAQAVLQPNSFYIGGDIGAANFMNKESHSVQSESHQLGSMGAFGGIFVGYDFGVMRAIRVAIEAFADTTDLETSLKHSANTYKMEQDYNLGLRILPEYVFTPFTIGHLIFGYVNGRFHINDDGVYGFINKSYNRSGFQAGLGMTTVFTNAISIRLDALYDGYSSSTNQGVGLSTSTQLYTNKFSQLAGELSVIYKFC
jgi:opacity protein-like surface antigen